MKKLLLMASAAAMAVTMPVLAQGNGKGNGKGGDKPAAAAKAQGQKGPKADKGRGNGKDEAKAAKRRAEARSKANQRHAKAEKERKERFREARSEIQRDLRRREDDRRLDIREDFRDRDARLARFDGCPPGLAKKNNGCLPPGQAKKIYERGDIFPANRFQDYNVPRDYRAFYPDSDDYYYRYEDGNIYRVDKDSNLVAGLIPLLGGGFTVGQPLPAGYDVYNVPWQYRDSYADTDDLYYRYGDGAIYGVDPQTQLIEGVVALLGGDLAIGQQLPAGYDVYNVPFDYRDRYMDNDDHLYRYANGGIYQVDPQTRLVQALVEMIL